MPKNTIEPIRGNVEQITESIVKATCDPMPKALYRGEIPINGVKLDCAVLDDKDNTRVINMTSVFKAFGRIPRSNARLINIPAFMDAKSLQPFVDKELEQLIRPIVYMDGTQEKLGYNSLILPALCNLYLKARRAGALTSKQEELAVKAEILQTSFASVGIAAIVDEATGFQRHRAKDALRVLLETYIADGLQKWLKTFPDSFFEQLDRLYGNEPTKSQNRPKYYGRFINTYIYNPIEKGYLKAELDKLNITDEGKRKARFHQWLTEDGKRILERQISKVEGRMEIFSNIQDFSVAEKKRKAVSIAPYLFEEMNKIIE